MKLLVTDWGNALDVVGFSFTMVFILLVMIVVVLNLFSKMIAPKVKVRKAKTVKTAEPVATVDQEYEEDHLTAGDSAAIAMALHLYYSEVHDEESAIITIKTVEKRYSPWSSKIYGLNNLVR